MAVVIVTDSTSDIEPSRAAELGITVVPLFVLFGQQSYRDYVDLSRADFYRKLATESQLPTTSQPSPEMFAEAFKPAVERGDEVLCLTISSKLSGTMNAARAAAERFPAGSVTIVDSLSVAGGLGMQAMHAADLARGGAGVAEISAALENDRKTERLYACIPDLSHVVRTGRIGRAAAVIGTLMRIVPVITLRDGEVAAEAQVRTLGRAQETMLDLAIKNVPHPERGRFLVMHTNAPELAADIAQRLLNRLGGVAPRSLEMLEAGPVIGTHAGPGAVGIFSVQD